MKNASLDDHIAVRIEEVKTTAEIQQAFDVKMQAAKKHKSARPRVFRPRDKARNFSTISTSDLWNEIKSGDGNYESFLSVLNRYLDLITLMGYLKVKGSPLLICARPSRVPNLCQNVGTVERNI